MSGQLPSAYESREGGQGEGGWGGGRGEVGWNKWRVGDGQIKVNPVRRPLA